MTSDLRDLLRAIAVLVLSVCVFLLAKGVSELKVELKDLTSHYKTIQKEVEYLREDNQNLRDELNHLKEEGIDVNIKIEDLFSSAERTSMTVTAYAPLDPNAVPGVCFSGDPNVTASGERPIPGETVAAALPFGTVLYIEGIGLRRVNDRGVGPGRVDVVVNTRAEAFKIGRSQRRVIILGTYDRT